MILRRIAGGALGMVLWWILFFALGIGFGLLWPAYATAAIAMMDDGDFQGFTTPMHVLNLLVFLIDGLIVGWVTTLVSRSRHAALAIAALLLVYAMIEHFIRLWNELPAWYNLVVPFVIAGAVAVGARIPVGRRAWIST